MSIPVSLVLYTLKIAVWFWLTVVWFRVTVGANLKSVSKLLFVRNGLLRLIVWTSCFWIWELPSTMHTSQSPDRTSDRTRPFCIPRDIKMYFNNSFYFIAGLSCGPCADFWFCLLIKSSIWLQSLRKSELPLLGIAFLCMQAKYTEAAITIIVLENSPDRFEDKLLPHPPKPVLHLWTCHSISQYSVYTYEDLCHTA